MTDFGITIEPTAAFCPRHLDPFRATWPNGYLSAAMCLVYQALQRPEIDAAAGNDTAMLDRVLREFGPLCCLIGDDTTAAITAGALTDDKDTWRKMMQTYGPPPTRPPT